MEFQHSKMCISPIILRNKHKGNGDNLYTTPVPCGQCPLCKKSRFNSWAFRLEKETQISINPLFITLTYAEHKLPYGNNQPTLHKKDVQDFFKRLRKNSTKDGDKALRYYAVGEYGSRTLRPHYHIILFNLTNPDHISTAWQNGFDYTLPLKPGGIQYTLKYLQKDGNNKDYPDKQPPFSLMSKGLGSNYLTSEMVSYHNASVKNSHVTREGGQKQALPKYYKEKLYTDDMRQEVTHYLNKRSKLSEIAAKALLWRENPKLTKDEMLNLYDYRKINIKFKPSLKHVL
jgi:hypothetical protein